MIKQKHYVDNIELLTGLTNWQIVIFIQDQPKLPFKDGCGCAAFTVRNQCNWLMF